MKGMVWKMQTLRQVLATHKGRREEHSTRMSHIHPMGGVFYLPQHRHPAGVLLVEVGFYVAIYNNTCIKHENSDTR